MDQPDLPFSVMLTEASPIAESPVDLGVELRPHQKAALRRCIDIETNGVSFDMVRNLIPHWVARNVNTRIMGLCESPGAGKSHVIIALCAGDTPVPPASVKVSLCSGMMSYDKLVKHEKEIKTSVVVVPHGILSQWKGYLEGCTGVDYIVLGRRTEKAMQALAESLATGGPSILLCSDTVYPSVFDLFASRGLRAKRFVLDEADTIPLPNAKFVSANMNWMVTSNMKSLVMTYRHRTMCNKHACGWWKELYEYARVMRSLLVVKSADAFLRASMSLPPPRYEDVECDPPPGASVLRGLVPDSVQEALDTDDVDLALSYIGKNSDTDDIVALVRNKWRASIDEKRERLRKLEGMSAGDDPDFSDYLNGIRKAISDREAWLATLEERIAGEDICGICHETVSRRDERAMMGCCYTVYCLPCAYRWVSEQKTCPICRKSASFDRNVHAMTDLKRVRKTRKAAAKELVERLCGDPDNRIIFCSTNAAVFGAILFPAGNVVLRETHVQKTVAAFRDGGARTLCVSGDCGYTGVNLEFATDIVLFSSMGDAEDRIIGRAQRPGRTGALRVWRLVYSDLTTGE
jgi:Ring finger domain